MRSPTKESRTSGFAFSLLCTTAVIELVTVSAVIVASATVAEAAPYGRTGTIAACLASAVVALVGAIVGWRGAANPLRSVTAVILLVAVGILAALVLFFALAGGVALGLAVLLCHSAFSVAMIGRAVLNQRG